VSKLSRGRERARGTPATSRISRVLRAAYAQNQVQALLRIVWDTVGRIAQRVVADHLDERRLAGLVAIGCDELSYRRGQRYLN